MKCLETRRRGPGLKWRRYRTESGATWCTYEVPVAVLRTLGDARLREELQRSQRTLERLERNALAARMLAAGDKPAAVAHEVGMSESMVRRLRQRLTP